MYPLLRVRCSSRGALPHLVVKSGRRRPDLSLIEVLAAACVADRQCDEDALELAMSVDPEHRRAALAEVEGGGMNDVGCHF